jgi:hypothetical protein
MSSYRFLLFAVAASSFAQSWEASGSDDRQVMTAEDRVNWVAMGTIGPRAVIGNTLTAGWSTYRNSPHEYGSNWSGFGQRYGIATATGAVSNTIEAGLGSLWGEDPRYVRQTGATVHGRLKSIVTQTFMARNANQHLMPAYARYIAIPSSQLISNNWRVDREATMGDAAVRTGLSFVGRMASNAVSEFWPDIHRMFSRDKSGL